MENLTTFINIQTDFGFKKIFGTEKNKPILIRFLNALFAGAITVDNVVYHDKEMLPSGADGKRIIYDIYCTANGGSHHFILEMQNCYRYPFEDRVLYYTSRIVAEQGSQGWNYLLKPVISVVFTNFDLSGLRPALIHDMVFADRNTGEVMSEKMRIMFLSLKFMENKTWADCHNEIERLLYLIKNMDKMDKDSEIYRSGEYEEIFDASQTESLVGEEMVAYSNSLQRLKDDEYSMNHRYDEGLAEGEKRGRKAGLAEGEKRGRKAGLFEGEKKGRNEERRKSIKLMTSLGISVETISEQYGLTTGEILSILAS